MYDDVDSEKHNDDIPSKERTEKKQRYNGEMPEAFRTYVADHLRDSDFHTFVLTNIKPFQPHSQTRVVTLELVL